VDADNLCGALAIVGSLLVYGRGLAGLVLKVHNSINEPYASSDPSVAHEKAQRSHATETS
jgi:hypothetical protein